MDIWIIMEYTASVTIIGLLIWLIKLIFHDKLDARWHYFIWLVLLVRILVPVHVRPVPTPLSVFQEIPLGKWVEMGRILAQEKGYGELALLLGRTYLWGAGMLGAFYLGLWAMLRLQVALAPEADGAVREYVEGIAAKYGLPGCKDIRVRKSGTPYICGLVHPVLVIPASGESVGRARPDWRKGRENWQDVEEENVVKRGLPEEQVILHELLHKRYCDVLVNIVVHAVRVVNWFNPLVWLLTAAVQNDSEALCDQRVLECCGTQTARDYGELLIGMGERRRHNPVRIGTSNMAGSYRNMKIRIRRIRDFRHVPGKIGIVTLCITLMLAVSAIGSAAQEGYSFEVPKISSVKDLERALLYAKCYHAHTPQEAIYLFLRSCEERNTVYRMAVIPEEETARYEDFAKKWFLRQNLTTWEELSQEEGKAYPAYFPANTESMLDYRVYNLVYDKERGSAVVCATPHRRQGQARLEWRLELAREDGWKVWLAEESQAGEGEYVPEPLLAGSGRLGDFEIEVAAYNEGYFQELGAASSGFFLFQDSQAVAESYPQYFTTEYKCRNVTVSYEGEESLEGHRVKVLVADLGDEGGSERQTEAAGKRVSGRWSQVDTGETNPAEDWEELAAMAGEASGGRLGADDVECYSQLDSDGNGSAVFDGGELTGGAPRLVYGGGNGYSQPGYCWGEEDTIGIFVQIYIDGELAEEGEVWSGGL